MKSITRNLHLSITMADSEINVLITEPESGEQRSLSAPFSPDEHPLFNDQIGDELYSWFSLWADELLDEWELGEEEDGELFESNR